MLGVAFGARRDAEGAQLAKQDPGDEGEGQGEERRSAFFPPRGDHHRTRKNRGFLR